MRNNCLYQKVWQGLLKRYAKLILLICAVIGVNGCGIYNKLGTKSEGEIASLTVNILPVTGLQTVNAFDLFVDQSTIHLIVTGSIKDLPNQSQVRYLSSVDGGEQWSAPIEIKTTAPAPIATRGNDLQLAAVGQSLVAVWQTQGEFPNMGPIVSVYSLDAGKTWFQGENPAGNQQGDQSHLDLAADSERHFHAVWLEDPEENGYQSLRYARSKQAGKLWEDWQTLDTSTCSCCWNKILAAPEQSLKILYRDMEPRDMALIQSNNNGDTWHAASTVGAFKWKFEGCPHIGGALTQTVSVTPQVHSLVWTGAEGLQGLYYLRSSDNGRSWTAPYRMGLQAMHSDIAANATQKVVAVWDERDAEGTNIVMAQSFDEGVSWQPSERLSKTASVTHPRIVSTGVGFLSAWTEKLNKRSSQLVMAFTP